MKTDLYTKTVLTVIAVALMGIFLKPIVTPSTVQAVGVRKFGHLQSVGAFGTTFFDTTTGGLWFHDIEKMEKGGNLPLFTQYQLVELGKPLQKIR